MKYARPYSKWYLGARRAVTLFMIAALVGCSSVEERQERALHVVDQVSDTASGATVASKSVLRTSLDAVLMVVYGVKGIFHNVEDQVETVSEVVEKIQEGKQQIEEGIQGE